jgi:hypothetical protein
MRNADAMTRKLRENRVGRRARLARRGAASAGEDARDRRADARDRARGVPARFPPLAGRDAVPTPEIRRGARFAHRAMRSQTLNGVARQRLRRETGERHRRRRRTRRGDGRRWRTYHLFFPNLALLACASLKGTARVLGRGDGARRKTRSRTRGTSSQACFAFLVVCRFSHRFTNFSFLRTTYRASGWQLVKTIVLPRRKKRP